MRDEDRRTKKYKAKLDGSITGQRFEVLGESMKSQMKEKAAKAVDIELKVKQIVKDEPGTMTFFYLAFAKEVWGVVERHGRDTNKVRPLVDKWDVRGLKRELMEKILNDVFNILPPPPPPPPPPPLPIQLGAKLWLRYEETSGNIAYDSSGYGHNAALTDTTWEPSGKIGRCIGHNVITAQQVVAHHEDINPNPDLSVVFWLYMPGTILQDEFDVIGKIVPSGNGFDVRGGDAGGGNFGLFFATYIGGVGQEILTAMSYGNWHHIVFRMSGTKFDVWVDNSKVGEISRIGNYSNTGNLLIGAGYEFNISFLGKIDEFMIFKRWISDSEINQLYNWTGG
jgi:hypothetical protein